MMDATKPAGRLASPLTEVLGLDPKRAAFERFAQACPMGRYSVDRDTRPGRQDGYWSSHTQIMWDAWCAAWGCQQASIDRLMLEWCPDEMTPHQMAEWAKAQVAAPGFDEAALDAALKA